VKRPIFGVKRGGVGFFCHQASTCITLYNCSCPRMFTHPHFGVPPYHTLPGAFTLLCSKYNALLLGLLYHTITKNISNSSFNTDRLPFTKGYSIICKKELYLHSSSPNADCDGDKSLVECKYHKLSGDTIRSKVRGSNISLLKKGIPRLPNCVLECDFNP